MNQKSEGYPRYQTTLGNWPTYPEYAKRPAKGFQDHPGAWYEEAGTLSEEEQDCLLKYLNQLVADLEGPDSVRWQEWGIVEDYWPEMPGLSGSEQGRTRTMDVARWRICLELRWSDPVRLSAGVDHLQWLARHFLNYNSSIEQDPVLCLYLGAALERRGGQDEQALELLSTPNLFTKVNARNQILGRASLSRLHRRSGKVDKAEAEEEAICSWIRGHPLAMLPSVALAQLRADGERENSIIARLDGFFDEYTQLSPTSMLAPNGVHVQMNPSSTQPHDIFSFRPLEANKKDKHECWVSGCRADGKLSRCARCKVALYCSSEHQRIAWPRHKGLCGRYAQAGATSSFGSKALENKPQA